MSREKIELESHYWKYLEEIQGEKRQEKEKVERKVKFHIYYFKEIFKRQNLVL